MTETPTMTTETFSEISTLTSGITFPGSSTSSNVTSDPERCNLETPYTLYHTWPILVFAAVAIVLSFVGNLLVLFIYNYRWRAAGATTIYISCLATSDLLCGLLTIPNDLLLANFTSVRSPYLHLDLDALCKITSYLSFGLRWTSAFLLLVIAVRRFLKLDKTCRMYRGTLRRRPQTPTLGNKLSKVINSDMGAKGISLTMFVLSFIMTIPVITVYSNAPENSCLFKLQDGFSCYLACGVSREMKDSVIAKTFFSFAFIVFVATALPMVVLYAVVGFRIRASERDRQELEVKSRQMSPRRPYSMHVSYPDCPSPKQTMTRQRSMPINEREPEASAAVSGAYNGGSTYFPPISYSAHFASAPHLAHIFEDINEGNVRDFAQCSTTSFQMAKRGSKARNTTFALMLISMAYVMSYLPYLSLTMVRRFTKAWCESDEAPEIIIATEFFRRTYLISSAINPLIYGFCNPTFRKVLWKLLAHRRDVI